MVHDPLLDVFLAEPVRVPSASAGSAPPVEWVRDSDHALRLPREAAEHATRAYPGAEAVAVADLWRWL